MAKRWASINDVAIKESDRRLETFYINIRLLSEIHPPNLPRGPSREAFTVLARSHVSLEGDLEGD